jgi:hypothetical protein
LYCTSLSLSSQAHQEQEKGTSSSSSSSSSSHPSESLYLSINQSISINQSSASIGGDGNGNNSSNVMMNHRPRSSLLHAPNENVVHTATTKAAALSSSDTNTTTTPAKSLSRPRRAFGDISNKKAPNGNGGGGGGKDHGSSSKSNKASVVLKPSSHHRPSSNTSFTPRSSSNNNNNTNKQQFQSRIPKTAGSSKHQQQLLQQPPSQRTHPWSTHAAKKPTSSLPKSSSSSLRRQVDFILPTMRVEPQEQLQSMVDSSQPQQFLKTVEPVDDVEYPAGRMWSEQLKTDDPFGEHDGDNDNDDDDDETSFLDRRTMWDDWKETMHRQWKEERLELELADERQVQAQLDRVIHADSHNIIAEQQGMICVVCLFVCLFVCIDTSRATLTHSFVTNNITGLESLFDSIDALRLDKYDDDDALDLHLDHLLEDDEWSEPASSVDGTLEMTFEI